MAGLARAGIGVEVVGQKETKRRARAAKSIVLNCMAAVVRVCFRSLGLIDYEVEKEAEGGDTAVSVLGTIERE